MQPGEQEVAWKDEYMSFDDVAASIEQSLGRLGRATVLDALRPGASAGVVRSRLSAVGLQSSEPVESLYRWHDGTRLPADRITDDVELIPGFYFLSLEDACAERQARVGSRNWGSHWLPILTDGGGYFYLADLGDGQQPSMRIWEFDSPGASQAFRSIEDMFATFDAALTRQIIVADRDGYLEMDQVEFERLCAELNPGMTAWSN